MKLFCGHEIAHVIRPRAEDSMIVYNADELHHVLSERILVVLVYPWEIVHESESLITDIRNRIEALPNLTIIYGGPGETEKFGMQGVTLKIFTPREYREIQKIETQLKEAGEL